MKRTTYQVPELRDENDNIIQQGAFGKNTALANSTNDGWIDYVANDLMYLYNNTMGGTGGEINTETITGQTGTITTLTATTVKAGTVTADALSGPLTGNVTGDLNGNVTGDVTGNLTGNVTGDLNGNVTGDVTGNLTGNVTGTADKAVADGNGNNIVNTYVTKSDLSSSVSTTSLTVSGETSVPTANAGNSSKAIANTAYVQGELTNYLPLSGGTLAGVVNGVTPPNGDNSKKLATTEFVNAKAGNYLPLSGGTVTGGLTVEGTITGNLAGNADTATNATNATNDANGNPIASTYLPAVVGAVVAFAGGSTTPQGWLLCDGSAVSRTDYAALYAVIGTTYGAGDGTSTFNLPNLTDKFIEGSATSGTEHSAGLPNITGRISMSGEYGFDGIFNADNRGAFNTNTAYQNGWQATTTQISIASKSSQALFDASRSSAIYGNSNTVQPPSVTMRYIIKY